MDKINPKDCQVIIIPGDSGFLQLFLVIQGFSNFLGQSFKWWNGKPRLPPSDPKNGFFRDRFVHGSDKEVAPSKIRGMLVGIYQNNVSLDFW